VVARDEGAHLTASHFEVFTSCVEVGRTPPTLVSTFFQIIGGSFGRKFAGKDRIQSSDLLDGVLIGLNGLLTSLLELP